MTGYPTPGIINAKTGAVIVADAYDSWNNNPSMLEGWLAQC